MKSTLLPLIIALCLCFNSFYGQSQDCGCDYTISPLGGLQVYEPEDFAGIGPGSVICINGGDYEAFRFVDLVGSEADPIVIKNCDGEVDINSQDVNYGTIQFFGCQYIHMTGAGDDNFEYGIHIERTRLNDEGKSGLSGVSIGALSSDFEIDHMEIEHVGFAGIIAKTDPASTDCDSEESQATFRENFTLRNLNIHHNYIHDTGGEGMYIGATYGYHTTIDVCGGFAHLLENVHIHNNILEQTGWDAIQVSLAHENTKIHDNLIDGYAYHASQEGEINQSFGIALGGGVRAEVYNNEIIQYQENTTSIQRGISAISVLTGTKVYNNVIVGSGSYGIWFHIRHIENEILTDLEEDLGYHFINNTVIEPGAHEDGLGVGIYISTCQPVTEGDAGCNLDFNLNFKNNLVVNPKFTYESAPGWMYLSDVYIQLVNDELRDSQNTHRSNNLYVRENPSDEILNLGATPYSEILFTDAENYDYTLLENSAAIDAGEDVSEYGITTDFFGNIRPTGDGYDIGAYEYGADVLSIESEIENNELINLVYPNPTNDIVSVDVNTELGSRFTLELYDINGSKLFGSNYVKKEIPTELDLRLIAGLQSQTLILLTKTNQEYQVSRIQFR